MRQAPVGGLSCIRALHKARPDVQQAVRPCHHDLSTTSSLVRKRQLGAIQNHAVRLGERDSDACGFRSQLASRRALAECGPLSGSVLGRITAMLSAAHCHAVVAENVQHFWSIAPSSRTRQHFYHGSWALAGWSGRSASPKPKWQHSATTSLQRAKQFPSCGRYMPAVGVPAGVLVPEAWWPLLSSFEIFGRRRTPAFRRL